MTLRELEGRARLSLLVAVLALASGTYQLSVGLNGGFPPLFGADDGYLLTVALQYALGLTFGYRAVSESS